MDATAALAMNAAVTRQAIALEMVKMAADMDKQLVGLIQESVDNVPVSGRGGLVNFTA